MHPEPSWHDEKVKRPEEVINFKWYSDTARFEVITDIELSKIVGTDHCRYYDDNWREMMNDLKPRRSGETFPFRRYFEMVRNEHDHSAGTQPITVCKYGEEYILCQSGNHRICHAKFDGIRFLRLRVQEYIIDPARIEADIANQRIAIEAAEGPVASTLWQRVLERFGI